MASKQKLSEKPNWDKVDKCSIWKFLGVTECDNCKYLVECWGIDTQLEINDRAIEKLLNIK